MPTKRELLQLLQEEERRRFSPAVQALYFEAESDPGKGKDWLTVTDQMQLKLVRDFGFGDGALKLTLPVSFALLDDPAFQNASVYVRENLARKGTLSRGDEAPDVPLLTMDLVETSTRDLFAAASRPVVDLYSIYRTSCEFATIYILEAHASDVWPNGNVVEIPRHRTAIDRQKAALSFVQQYNYTIPVFLDTLSDSFERAYAPWPFRFYIVKDGKMAFVGMPKEGTYDTGEVRGNKFTILTKEFEGKDYDWEPHRIFNSVDAAGKAGIDWDYIIVGTKVGVAISVFDYLSGSANELTCLMYEQKAIPESFSCGELVKPAVTSQKTGIILIQNGVGIERDSALLFPNNLICSAVAFMAATREGEAGVVKHYGVTTMPIGVYRGEDLVALGKSYTPPADGDERILLLSRLWKEVGGISARYVEDLQPARWYKLLWNASFGPISVLTNVPSHPAIAADAGLLQFARENVTDIWHVAEKLFPGRFPPKIRLGPSLEEWPGKGVSRVGDHKASMLVDVEECRDAEIEVILGEPVRIAKRAGLALPRLETLYYLVKANAQQRKRDSQSEKVAGLH
ncbi:hypothetical protein HDU93_006510 [Gonapodya sp. JEL0774]|nr:hypothetical protein HDU93_006510 [Gonapodya sp. JEL0774]